MDVINVATVVAGEGLATFVLKETIKYAIPKTLDAAIEQLKKFSVNINFGYGANSRLPSAAMIGLGRCGTNICIEVAKQLESIIEVTSQTQARSTPAGIVDRMVQRFRDNPGAPGNAYLFQPIILLTDVDVRGTDTDKTLDQPLIVPGYTRCRRIDLDEFERHGCGNVPQVGQLVARMILEP